MDDVDLIRFILKLDMAIGGTLCLNHIIAPFSIRDLPIFMNRSGEIGLNQARCRATRFIESLGDYIAVDFYYLGFCAYASLVVTNLPFGLIRRPLQVLIIRLIISFLLACRIHDLREAMRR